MLESNISNTKRVHVHYHSSKTRYWCTRKIGALRALKIYKTRRSAIKNAEKFLDIGYDVVIHRTDGTVHDWKKAKAK